MSILVHHCRTCEHPEGHHLIRLDTPPERHDLYDPGMSLGPAKSCKCCARHGLVRDFDPAPTLHETRSYPERQPEPLMRPGDVWNAGTGHRQLLCGYDVCEQVYAELTA